MNITADVLIRQIRDVAVERPNYRNNPDGESQCFYFDEEGRPSCIVGHGFFRLGLTVADLGESNGDAVDALVDVIDADEADWVWLHQVQSAQDNGKTWREAVEAADRDAAERASTQL